jgi:hypothetical protein
VSALSVGAASYGLSLAWWFRSAIRRWCQGGYVIQLRLVFFCLLLGWRNCVRRPTTAFILRLLLFRLPNEDEAHFVDTVEPLDPLFTSSEGTVVALVKHPENKDVRCGTIGEGARSLFLRPLEVPQADVDGPTQRRAAMTART